MRKVYVSAQTPQGHGLVFNGEFKPLESIVCDSCSQPLHGHVVLAISYWDGNRGVMRPWEHEYGTVLTEEAVAVLDKMEGVSK